MKLQLIAALFLVSAYAAGAESFPVRIKIDAAQPSGPLKPIWRFFGADEPNYAYMKHGSELLGELGALKKDEVFFRTHSLLVTGKGEHGLKWGSTNAYTEDAAGNPVYDWTIVDRIFDAYRGNGVRPYVQIGFMPQALSVKPEPYRHHFPNAKYRGDVSPAGPIRRRTTRSGRNSSISGRNTAWKDTANRKCSTGIGRRGTNRTSTIGEAPVRSSSSSTTTPSAPCAAPSPRPKSADPISQAARVATFWRAFLNHCLKGTNLASGEKGTPLDFISFHAKGSPKQVDGHVRMGISTQLSEINDAFGVIAKYPELKSTPIVIGESDPEGCAACQGPNLAYRNGTMYSSYTAASFPRKLDLAEKHGVNLEGALTWAFEFEGQPYFAGFRSLATNGIDKPVLNVFRMFSRMDGQRLRVAERWRGAAR